MIVANNNQSDFEPGTSTFVTDEDRILLNLFKKTADIIWITTKYNFRSENLVNFPLADFVKKQVMKQRWQKENNHFPHRFWFDIKSRLRAIWWKISEFRLGIIRNAILDWISSKNLYFPMCLGMSFLSILWWPRNGFTISCWIVNRHLTRVLIKLVNSRSYSWWIDESMDRWIDRSMDIEDENWQIGTVQQNVNGKSSSHSILENPTV
jgi:hypothetical protein